MTTIKFDKYGNPKKQRHIIRRSFAILGLIIGLCLVVGVSCTAWYFNKESKQAQELHLTTPKESIIQNLTILDANGAPLQQGKNQTIFEPVTLKGSGKNVSDLYIDTLLATEDDTFYTRKTDGYSLKGLAGAVYSEILYKLHKTNVARGGSTIDQQLVKNIALGGDKADLTISRKVIELIDAHSLATRYSRDEVLTAYINSLRLYPNTIGMNAAYQSLFGVSVPTKNQYDAESLDRIAFVAGLGQAPSSYLQQFETEGRKRAKVVLGIMLDKEIINSKQYQLAAKNLSKFTLKPSKVQGVQTAYQAYVAEVNNEISTLSLPATSDVVIKTYATQAQLQQLNAIANFTAPSQKNIPYATLPNDCLTAISAIDTKTGHILGLATNSENPMTPLTSERSSGSSIKPLLDYAPALEFGAISTNSSLNGNTTHYSDGTPLSNYGNYNYGQVSAGYALGNSLNTAAYQTYMMTSITQKNAIMQPLGIAQESYLESDSIGYNISTLQEASAYTAIGNDGVRVTPTAIQSITVNGKPLSLSPQVAVRAMSSVTARSLQQLMQNVTLSNGSEPYAAMPQWSGGYAVKSGLVGFNDQKTAEINSKVGNVMPSSDAWLAATSTGVTVSAWLGTPDMSGNTYIVGGGIYPENNGRVYLLDNAMITMNSGRNVTPFEFSGQKLQQTKGLKTIPNRIKDVSSSDLLDLWNYKAPKVTTVPDDKQKWYEDNKDKRIYNEDK